MSHAVPFAGTAKPSMPGLRLDDGMVVGDDCAVLASSWSHLSSFVSAYTATHDLPVRGHGVDLRVLSETDSEWLFLEIPASTREEARQVADAAEDVRLRCFVGGNGRFVRVADSAAAAGYDLASPITLQPGQFALCDIDGTALLAATQTLPTVESLLSLPLGRRDRHLAETEIWAVGPRALLPELREFTIRHGADAEIADIDANGRRLCLVKVANPPRGLIGAFESLPQVRCLTGRAPLMFQRGRRHAVSDRSLRRLLPKGRMLLVTEAGPLLVPDDLRSTPVFDLADVDPSGPVVDAVGSREAGARFALPVRLAPDPELGSDPDATLLTGNEISWLVEMLHDAPRSAFDTLRIIPAGGTALLRGVRDLPVGVLGAPLSKVYADIFVPLGTRLSPDLPYSVLRDRLGLDGSAVAVFAEDRVLRFNGDDERSVLDLVDVTVEVQQQPRVRARSASAHTAAEQRAQVAAIVAPTLSTDDLQEDLSTRMRRVGFVMLLISLGAVIGFALGFLLV